MSNKIILIFDYTINEEIITINPAIQAEKFKTSKEISLSHNNKTYEIINYNEYTRLIYVLLSYSL